MWLVSSAVRRAATVCDAQPSTVLSTSAHDPAAIAADATNVYVVDLYDLALVKINRANGLATKLLDLEHPVALVLSQGSLFLSDWDKGIERLSLDGAVLNADLVGAHAGFFAVSGSTIVTDAWDGVYYASWPSGSFGGEIAETTSAGGIAVDGSTVYFVDGAGVWRAPFASNGAKLIAPDLGGAFIAVDDACVYYATNDRIVRTPK